METNNVAEAMALWQGLNQALYYGIQSLTVIGDSRLIIQSMNSMKLPSSIRLRQILRRIGLITPQFRAIDFYHILRKNNEHADKAANDSMGLGKGVISSGCQVGLNYAYSADLPHESSRSYTISVAINLQKVRLLIPRVELPSFMLMQDCTCQGTTDQDRACSEILQNRMSSFHSSLARAVSFSSELTGMNSLKNHVIWHAVLVFCFENNQVSESSSSLKCTGPGIVNPQRWLIEPPECLILTAIKLHLCHGNDFSIINLIRGRLASLPRNPFALEKIGPGWRNQSELHGDVLLQTSNNILGPARVMVDSGHSAASSPDPLLELEAEIRVLRRRVRRQGEFVHQMDEYGGRRLERMDEDIGSIRAEFAAALEAMEARVTTAIENMDFRLRNLEKALETLRETGKTDKGKNQLDSNPSSRAKHR